MKLPTVKLVYDRKNEADEFKNPKRSKKGLLQVEIYYNRSRKWMSTGVKLYKGQWHENKWVVNHPDSSNLNAQLKALLEIINGNITAQITDSGVFSFAELQSAIESSSKSEQIEEVIQEIIDDYIAVGKRHTTYMMFSAMRTSLREYGKVKVADDLTYNNIVAFDKFLRTKKHFSGNTICLYHAKLKRVCCILMSNGKLARNPYDNFAIVKPKNDKVRYLREEELKTFKEFPLTKKCHIFSRDVAMFQAMTGLAYSDAIRAELGVNVILRDDKYVLIDERIKTSVQYSVVILPSAVEILRKYGGNLNRITIDRQNEILHELGMMIFGRRLTTHQFRHSFATTALRHDIPIEYVSKMLGHTNIQTTQRYAKVLAQDVIEQFDKLKDVF